MIELPLSLPSRIHRVDWSIARDMGVELWVKREDEIHPAISGNKWRKLKGHLDKCIKSRCRSIVSFGGAFSNHIYALAGCTDYIDIPIHIYVRGEEDFYNPTLKFIKNKKVTIHFLSREKYREKNTRAFLEYLNSIHDNPYVIPEGGSGIEAAIGVYEMMDEIKNIDDFDRLLICAGTGTTAIHMINQSSIHNIEVYGVLKGSWLNQDIQSSIGDRLYNYVEAHYGGYAVTSPPLIKTINAFYKETNIPVDPIYNGKLISELSDRIKNRRYSSGEKLLWIHTGGLQGIEAYNYMAEKKDRPLIEVRI